MNNSIIIRMRLANQLLSGTDFVTPKEIVSWMGAMQAQDFNAARWAIGIRIPGLTEEIVTESFNKGEILRTHVMRPTWHFVTPENIRWMLMLTGPRIKSTTQSRDRDLGITEELYSKCNHIIYNALEGDKYLTRDEIARILTESGILVDHSRMVHFMMRAELDGIVCSGVLKEKKHTYALLDERVPQTPLLNRDEALAKFAGMYFSSHGPATIRDFIWWSGLSATEARNALGMVRSDLLFETIGSQVYWFTGSSRFISAEEESVHLLPAFDEYVIGYKDRQVILSSENHSKAISSNGVFRPTIIRNGQVTGIWRKLTGKKKNIQPEFFEESNVVEQNLIGKASLAFNIYSGK